MCSAMPLRIAVIGSKVSPGCGSAASATGCGAGCGGVGGASAEQARRRRPQARAAAPAQEPVRLRLLQAPAGLRAGRGCAAGAAWPPPSTNARMSFFVTRPPRAGALDRARVDAVLGGDSGDDGRDEGAAVARRRWPRCGWLRAGPARRRRLTGGVGSAVSRVRRPRSSAARPRLRPAVAGSGGAASARRTLGALRARSRRARVPTSTVSPSWTRIFATTPSPGLGTSVSTLSVEISSSASSRAIGSPSGLEPLRDRPLGDGDAHLRHDDVDLRVRCHVS